MKNRSYRTMSCSGASDPTIEGRWSLHSRYRLMNRAKHSALSAPAMSNSKMLAGLRQTAGFNHEA